MKPSRLSAIALAVAVPQLAVVASAQDQSLVLEEIVVTAQKREESLTEAPLTVNLLSGAAMRDTAVFQGDELNKLTSGIEIRYEGDSNVGVGIRGIGTFAQQSAPPRVSTYLDDYFIAGSQTDFAFAALFDMRQVQILRGPQGTLYGQPSPTGAVILQTGDPNLEQVEGNIRASYIADPDGYNVQAGVSFPIIEGVLGARVAVLSDDRETGTSNVVRSLDESRNRDGVRAKLLWEPSDTFSAKLGYTYMRSENSETYRIVEAADAASDFQFNAADRNAIAGSPDEVVDKKDFLATLHLTWDAGWGTINWFTGDFGSSNLRDDDNDNTQYAAVSLPGTRTKFIKNVQHELRIATNPTDWWSVQFGGFLQDSKAVTDVVSLAGVPNQGVFEIILDIPTLNETKAVFAHNDFHLNDTHTLTLGLRYNIFDADASNIVRNRFHFGSELQNDNTFTDPIVVLENPLVCVIDPTQTEQCVNRRAEEDKEWTGTIKWSAGFSDALNVYATYDHGFRPGAPNFDVNGAFQPTEQDPTSGLNFYTGETVDSIEIGAKGSIWNGRGQYTSAVFYSIYEDYQIRPSFELWNSFAAAGAGAVASISNADVNIEEARQYGFEGELRYLASENLELFGSFTYAKVELTKGTIPCTDPSQTPVSAENRFNVCEADGLAGSAQPEIFLTLKADYHADLAAIGGEWYLSGLFNHRGDIEVPGDDQTQRFASGSYNIFDLFTGLRTDAWDAQLFVKNVFDEEGILARRASDSAQNNGNAAAAGGTAIYNDLSLTPPRTVGVTASFYF